MCIMCLQCPRGQRRDGHLRTAVTDGSGAPYGCQESNLGPPEEEPALLSNEPSLYTLDIQIPMQHDTTIHLQNTFAFTEPKCCILNTLIAFSTPAKPRNCQHCTAVFMILALGPSHKQNHSMILCIAIRSTVCLELPPLPSAWSYHVPEFHSFLKAEGHQTARTRHTVLSPVSRHVAHTV